MSRRNLRFAPALACAALLASRLTAQAPEDSVTRELRQLGETARLLNQSLPSFTCQETGVSEVLSGKKVKQHVAFTANLRAVRTPSGPLNESFTVTSINGQPFSGSFAFPFYVSGGFNQGMRYFAPSLQACYAYGLSRGRIDFHTAPDVADHMQCRNEGLHGFALLDPAGNVTHLERTVSKEADRDFRLVPFSAIDFAPVELNGQTFLLSRHMLAERRQGNLTGRFDVTYTDCKLFHVTVTIEQPSNVPPTNVPPTDTQPAPTPSPQ